jgi:endonuclease YncB( thermonuclease family)
MRQISVALCVVLVPWHAIAVTQDGKRPEADTGKPTFKRDRVKGSINHLGGKSEWQRLIGKARVIDAQTLQFEDGIRAPLLVVTPDLEQQGRIDGSFYLCGKEAAEFLRKLIGDRTVTCYLVEAQDKWIGYVGDTNIEHALIVNGWALAHHSGMNPAEITARENKRGLWRGEFVNPSDWRNGKRLPGEK